jgi:hypothetical protein
MRGSDRGLQEKVPIGEPHWEIASWDIGNAMDKVFTHFGIAMSETPMRGKTAVMGRVDI